VILVPEVWPEFRTKDLAPGQAKAVSPAPSRPSSTNLLYSADKAAEGRLDNSGAKRPPSLDSFVFGEGYLKDEGGNNGGHQ